MPVRDRVWSLPAGYRAVKSEPMVPRRAMQRLPNRVFSPIWDMNRSFPLGPARSSGLTQRESGKKRPAGRRTRLCFSMDLYGISASVYEG